MTPPEPKPTQKHVIHTMMPVSSPLQSTHHKQVHKCLLRQQTLYITNRWANKPIWTKQLTLNPTWVQEKRWSLKNQYGMCFLVSRLFSPSNALWVEVCMSKSSQRRSVCPLSKCVCVPGSGKGVSPCSGLYITVMEEKRDSRKCVCVCVFVSHRARSWGTAFFQ